MKGDHIKALITKHAKNNFKNYSLLITGVNAKNENRINSPDIINEKIAVNISNSLVYFGTFLKAIGLYK